MRPPVVRLQLASKITAGFFYNLFLFGLHIRDSSLKLRLFQLSVVHIILQIAIMFFGVQTSTWKQWTAQLKDTHGDQTPLRTHQTTQLNTIGAVILIMYSTLLGFDE